jgi:hypothetical protein
MNLAKLLNLNIDEVKVILIGDPTETNILDSNDEPYFVAKLKSPLMVRCSTDPAIEAQEIDEIYLRKSAVLAEGWTMVDEKKPEEGYFMPNWVADFSKTQMISIYQAESIKKWAVKSRDGRRTADRERINASIRESMAKRKQS